MGNIPKHIYLLNSAFDNYHKRGQNVAGTEHPCDGDDYTAWVRQDVHDVRIAELEELKVKALVWPEWDADTWALILPTPIGEFKIDLYSSRAEKVYTVTLENRDRLRLGAFKTLEAAITAVQTHFEKQILEQLTY